MNKLYNNKKCYYRSKRHETFMNFKYIQRGKSKHRKSTEQGMYWLLVTSKRICDFKGLKKSGGKKKKTAIIYLYNIIKYNGAFWHTHIKKKYFRKVESGHKLIENMPKNVSSIRK